MALEYRERSTLGTGSSGELVGHIQFGAQNLFTYYEGPENEVTSLLSDSDLEALRLRVEDHHRRWRPIMGDSRPEPSRRP